MSYRMDHAARPRSAWGYQIDYDKAIAEDEKRIAELSCEFARTVAAECDRFVAIAPDQIGRGYWKNPSIAALLEFSPAVRAASGLTADQVRGFLVRCYDMGSAQDFNSEAAGLGPTKREDWAAGKGLMDLPCPSGGTWWDSCGFTEEIRAADLKRAKASLSRHKRNKAKFGG